MTPLDEDTLAAIRAEKALAKLPSDDRDLVLAGLSETARHMKSMRQQDRYGDRALHLRNRDVLKAHLAPILRVLDDDVGATDGSFLRGRSRHL
jgi:hypothetical protein